MRENNKVLFLIIPYVRRDIIILILRRIKKLNLIKNKK